MKIMMEYHDLEKILLGNDIIDYELISYSRYPTGTNFSARLADCEHTDEGSFIYKLGTKLEQILKDKHHIYRDNKSVIEFRPISNNNKITYTSLFFGYFDFKWTIALSTYSNYDNLKTNLK